MLIDKVIVTKIGTKSHTCFGLTPELRKLTPDGPGYSGCQAFWFCNWLNETVA
jgi:hypothetical protein